MHIRQYFLWKLYSKHVYRKSFYSKWKRRQLNLQKWNLFSTLNVFSCKRIKCIKAPLSYISSKPDGFQRTLTKTCFCESALPVTYSKLVLQLVIWSLVINNHCEKSLLSICNINEIWAMTNIVNLWYKRNPSTENKEICWSILSIIGTYCCCRRHCYYYTSSTDQINSSHIIQYGVYTLVNYPSLVCRDIVFPPSTSLASWKFPYPTTYLFIHEIDSILRISAFRSFRP